MEYSIYMMYYIVVAAVVLLINSFIAGFTGNEAIKKDFIGSALWPVTIMVFLGTLTNICITLYKNKKKKAKNEK